MSTTTYTRIGVRIVQKVDKATMSRTVGSLKEALNIKQAFKTLGFRHINLFVGGSWYAPSQKKGNIWCKHMLVVSVLKDGQVKVRGNGYFDYDPGEVTIRPMTAKDGLWSERVKHYHSYRVEAELPLGCVDIF